MKNVFAVFVIVPVSTGKFAATTRAADRNETGIGLPGGKLDPGESPINALYRESQEEGWKLSGINPIPVHSQYVDGNWVQWYTAKKATKLSDFKEKGRIFPVVATASEILQSGYGNENLTL